MPLTASDLVADARGRIREIESTQFKAQCDSSGQPVLIDVREPAEYETGYLPGAINIPRGVLEFQVDSHPAVANATDPALAHRERPVVVYCRTGGRAALSADNLQKLGFTDVQSIQGGIEAWREAGLPIVSR